MSTTSEFLDSGEESPRTTDYNSKADILTSEYQYYSAAIRNLAPTFSNVKYKSKLLQWIKKLFNPEYHANALKEKRNRYLASLILNLLNNEMQWVFKEDAPLLSMRNILKVPIWTAPLACWELDKTVSNFNEALPQNCEQFECTFHGSSGQCDEDDTYCEQLDNEFRFLLHQMRPLAAMVPCRDSKTKVAAWLQTLCRANNVKCCKMKELCNDYSYCLYGYLQDLRVVGPFQNYPMWTKLPLLVDNANNTADEYPLTSPLCEETKDFMSCQSEPEEGAFCYIAVTGELSENNFH